MDTSETYIKMADCPEIQEGHTPAEGDWLVNTSAIGGTHLFVNYLEQKDDNKADWSLLVEDYCPSHLIWLPRQDQLQEMVGQWTTVELFGLFCVWFRSKVDKMMTSTGGTNPFITGEQLWLAFVMKEKHGKAWTGKDWVNA